MTRTTTDTCRLRHYHEAFATQDHLVFPQIEAAPHTQEGTLTDSVPAEVPRPIPTLTLPEIGSNEGAGVVVAAPQGDDINASEEKFGRLMITNEAGSCSDVSSCNYQGIQRPRQTFPGRSSASRVDDSDSDEDGNGYGGTGDGDAVYDSDLDSEPSEPGRMSHAKKMRRWKSFARGRFEKMLLECIVNTDRIAPDYRDIYISRSTIDKLEHVTTLSLTRPTAFGHGVLKGNKVTGGILYGPPGTGKSLLAKGMAKQSGFTMLAISTAELYQKCHGEDEKVIKAVFSLARKLYPSIVFIDEADAMLGSRKAGEKRHIRAMLNQFLMEWDGLTSGGNSPFILLATNRPSDLDPAVLRRAPVHIHLDIPTMEERLGIIRLLLQDEVLDPNINHFTLASLTKGYTGSDLKNLCVTAATECVSKQPFDTKQRCLTRQHFFSALETIRATNVGKTMANEFKNFEKGSGNAHHDEDEG